MLVKRFFACLLALAACEPAGQQPISEEIFVANPPAEAPAPAQLPGAAQAPAAGGSNTPGDVVDPALAMVEQDPYGQVIDNTSSGLTERLPDTCKLETFQYLQGLTPAAVAVIRAGALRNNLMKVRDAAPGCKVLV